MLVFVAILGSEKRGEDLRCVGGVHAQCDDVGPEVEVGHVESGETAVQVVKGESVQENGGDHADEAADDNDNTTKLFLCNVFGKQENGTVADVRGCRLDDTSRHGEKSRTLGRVSKAIDNQRREVGQSSVRDRDPDVEEEDEPGLGIEEGLNHLLAFEGLVFNTRLVGTNSLDGNGLFTLSDEFGLYWIVWEEDSHDECVDDGHGTGDPEE